MKKLKNDNRGFSLVELIVAVAIIGIVSVPILHSFITSTAVSVKSAQLADAGTAAENIIQISQIFSKDAVMKHENENMLSALGVTNDTVFTENGNTIGMSNITAGGKLYDAQIIYNSGDKNNSKTKGFYEINNRGIAAYTSMDGVFTQGYKETKDAHGNVDTDIQALAAYNSAIAGANLVSKEREIEITITKNVIDENSYNVFADVTYTYLFKYTVGDGTSERIFRYTKTYSVFEEGFKVEKKFDDDGNEIVRKDNENPNAYIMYFPYYDSNKETISINNLQNVKINLYLIKQCPIYYDEAENVYKPVTDDAVKKSELEGKENTHVTEIKQYFPHGYNNEDESVTALYTNAGINLATNAPLSDGKLIYQIFSGGLWYASASSRVDGNLVFNSKSTRIWQVTVNIYAAGNHDKLLYTLTTSKLV